MKNATFRKTHTGSFPLGFRLGWSAWQKDLEGATAWALQNQLGVIDIGRDADQTVSRLRQAGLRIGSADLLEWQSMISPDSGKRNEAVAKNGDYIRAATREGTLNFFCVMLPEKPELPRRENFAFMVESFSALVPVLEATGSKVVIEGWPGAGALCCTPEGYRALFREIPGSSIGVNYDPSHLVRMGIDPLRFLREFAGNVHHVHAKDTELLSEGLYEFGHLLPPTFGTEHGFGGSCWRYCIPGHGVVSWVEIFRILMNSSYKGSVCIELEDENFNGSTESEQRGLILSAQFLEGC